jgi:hypothetical protein
MNRVSILQVRLVKIGGSQIRGIRVARAHRVESRVVTEIGSTYRRECQLLRSLQITDVIDFGYFLLSSHLIIDESNKSIEIVRCIHVSKGVSQLPARIIT